METVIQQVSSFQWYGPLKWNAEIIIIINNIIIIAINYLIHKQECFIMYKF